MANTRLVDRDPTATLDRTDPDTRTSALAMLASAYLAGEDWPRLDPEDGGWSFFAVADRCAQDASLGRLGGWGGTTYANVRDALTRLVREGSAERGPLRARLARVLEEMDDQGRRGDAHGVGDWRKRGKPASRAVARVRLVPKRGKPASRAVRKGLGFDW